jgi:Zn-dependent protease with chaperone function
VKANRYFWATIISGGVVIAGLVGLAVRGFYPAYAKVLEWCGLSSTTCQSFFGSLSVVGIFAAAAIIWFGVVIAWQIIKTELLLRKMIRRIWPTPSFLQALGLRNGIGSRLQVVDGSVLFCAGLIRPKVIIGRDLLKILTIKELEAALAHESYHLRNFDPLRMLLTTSLARSLFFIPAIGALAQGYLLEKELSADQCAEERLGKIYLNRALYKVLQKNAPSPQILPTLVPSFTARGPQASSIRMQSLQLSGGSLWLVSLLVLGLFALSLFKLVNVAQAGCS